MAGPLPTTSAESWNLAGPTDVRLVQGPTMTTRSPGGRAARLTLLQCRFMRLTFDLVTREDSIFMSLRELRSSGVG